MGTDFEVAKQIEYMISNGWNPCIEFAMPENALTLDHGPDGIISSVTCGYYSNRYWPMWKLPMFGCRDPRMQDGLPRCLHPCCWFRPSPAGTNGVYVGAPPNCRHQARAAFRLNTSLVVVYRI